MPTGLDVRTIGSWFSAVLLGTALSVLAAGQFVCDYDPRVQIGTIAANEWPYLNEASGLVQSRNEPDVFWSQEDGPGAGCVFALHRDGHYLGTWDLDASSVRDTEDIAIGPGPIPGVDYIYLGDTGHNYGIWGCTSPNSTTGNCTGCQPGQNCMERDLRVWRFVEPDVDPNQSFTTVSSYPADVITLKFPDSVMLGQRQDVETLMVDPLNGDIYVATKYREVNSVFRAPYPHSTTQPITMEWVADLPDGQATAGDISADGRLIIMRRYGLAWIWQRPAGMTLGQALTYDYCYRPDLGENQGEAVAFDISSSGTFYTTSEGGGSVPIYLYRCRSGVCAGHPGDCNDLNDCTSDHCVAGTCEYPASGVCDLSGSVSYYRDFVGGFEPSNKPVPDVEIDLDGDALVDAVTDAAGNYAVPDLAGSFVIAPLPNYGDGEPADANGAVSPLDATFIAEYMVGLLELSVNQRAAADTSGNGTLSAFDAALVVQLSVGLLQHLPIADAEGSDWLYLRCDNYLAGNNHDCTEPLYVFDPLTQAEVTSFHAILYGDVTGNWSPPEPEPPPGAQGASPGVPLTPEQAAARVDLRRGAQLRAAGAHEVQRQRVRATPARLTLEGWDGPVESGMRRELSLELTEADGIEALDLVLGYDPAQISIVSVTALGLGEQLTLVSNDEGEAYRIAMYGILPLEGSGKLLSVTIEARSALGHLSPIEIEGAANEGGIPLRIQVSHPGTSKE